MSSIWSLLRNAGGDGAVALRGIRVRDVRVAALVWALVPPLQMLLFWFRWYYAVPAAALLVAGGVVAVREICTYRAEEPETIPLTKGVIAVLCFVPVWIVSVGIGGFIGQEGWDNSFRNAVLHELLEKPWPVTETPGQALPYMSYYFSYWLPAAAVGKVFGSYRVAPAALAVYSAAGMSLVALMVMHWCRRRFFLVGVLLLFFCGLDVVNKFIFITLLDWHNDVWVGCHIIGAPTAWYLCTFIYNQGIPAWVVLMLLYTMRRKTGLRLFLFAPLLFFSPFASLAVAPIVGVAVLRNLRRAFSLPNIAGFVSCLLIAIFYIGNGEDSKYALLFGEGGMQLYYILIYVAAYLIFNYFVFFPFIWKDLRRDVIFWSLLAVTLAGSMVIPGSYGHCEFGWKMTIPLYGLFQLKVMKCCASLPWTWSSKRSWLMGILLIIGAFSNYYLCYNVLDRWILLCKGRGYTSSERLAGKLFEREKNRYYKYFVTDHPTIYSEYFMPPAR